MYRGKSLTKGKQCFNEIQNRREIRRAFRTSQRLHKFDPHRERWRANTYMKAEDRIREFVPFKAFTCLMTHAETVEDILR